MQMVHAQTDCKLHGGYAGVVQQKWKRPVTDSTTESDSDPEKTSKLGKLGRGDPKEASTDNSDLEVEPQ